MATLTEKIECEQRMRKLLDDNGMPQPDEVEYGYTCVRFFFEESKACVVVDIDNPDDDASLDDVELAEVAAAHEDDPEFGYLETFADPLSDDPTRN